MSMRTFARSTNALRPASRGALSARFIASARVPQVVRAPAMRSFSTSVQRAEEFENPFGPNSLYKLTEEEQIKIAQRIGLIQHLPIGHYDGSKKNREYDLFTILNSRLY